MIRYVDTLCLIDNHQQSKSNQIYLTRKLAKCFQELRSKESRSNSNAKEIYLKLTSYRKVLGDFEQQDVGECFQALIGILNAEEKALSNQLHFSIKSLFFGPNRGETITPLPIFPFNGLVSSVVTCHQCNHSRPPRLQTFTELSIPIEAPFSTTQSFVMNSSARNSAIPVMQKLNKLSDCLGRFSAGEILSDVECLNCSYYTQVESLRILLDSSWSGDPDNKKSVQELNEKLNMLSVHHTSEKKLEELIPPHERERTTSSRQLMVSKYPEILCLQLMRTIFSPQSQQMVKLRHHVSFPLHLTESDMGIGVNYRVNLNLSPSSIRSVNSSQTSVGDDLKPRGRDRSPPRSSPKEYNYELQAVVVHHGGPESGHYTTYALVDQRNDQAEIEESKDGDNRVKGRRWAHFSDECVREVEEIEVLGCEAYVLFYHRLNS